MQCPKCGGTEFWDNRNSKKNPNAPDYRCRERECDGVIWLTPKAGAPAASAGAAPRSVPARPTPPDDAAPYAAHSTGPSVAGLSRDRAVMEECLTVGIELILAAVVALDRRAPQNDIAFSGDNICSVAERLFAEQCRRDRA